MAHLHTVLTPTESRRLKELDHPPKGEVESLEAAASTVCSLDWQLQEGEK